MTSRGERLDLLWSSLASKPGCASDTPGNVVRCCRLWGRIWCRLSCCRSQIGPKFVFFKTPVATSHWCRLPRCGGIRSSYLGKVGGGTCKHQAESFFSWRRSPCTYSATRAATTNDSDSRNLSLPLQQKDGMEEIASSASAPLVLNPPCTSESPGRLYKSQCLGHTPKLINFDSLQVGPGQASFVFKMPGWFLCAMKVENHCSRSILLKHECEYESHGDCSFFFNELGIVLG